MSNQTPRNWSHWKAEQIRNALEASLGALGYMWDVTIADWRGTMVRYRSNDDVGVETQVGAETGNRIMISFRRLAGTPRGHPDYTWTRGDLEVCMYCERRALPVPPTSPAFSGPTWKEEDFVAALHGFVPFLERACEHLRRVGPAKTW